MKISLEKLAAEAQATGFRPDVLEKVAHLLGLLDALRSHPFLKKKLVLKGGTALNLFIFDVPRLSVDIVLNYVGAEDRDGMLAERPKVEQAVQAVFAREGFTVRQLVPMLRVNTAKVQAESTEYGARLVRECREGLSAVLPFTDSERTFLDMFLDRGEIDPTLLTADTSLQQRIRSQPLLEWKALNVRHHKLRGE